MSRHSSQSLDCKIYVGDLAKDATERDLERAFSYYGPLKNVWVARNPPGFAFVEFEDARDADDAVRGLDGTTVAGERIRVENSTGKIRPKPWQRGAPRMRKPYNPNDRCYECGGSGHYAYDCGDYKRPRRRSRSRSRDRRRSYSRRSYSRSRSHSRDRSYRSRSRSPRRKDRNRGRSRSRTVSPICSTSRKSRSASPGRGDD